MRILITGGTGDVGRMATKRLVEHGHEVTVIGRRPDMDIEGGTYKQCDIVNFERLTEVMKGMDTVVHLAAIRNPSMDYGQNIFYVNGTGTFNVYRAAANEGITKLVSASSINALGYNFGIKRFKIRYFPMDEEHEIYTTDPYSFSKEVMEDIGAYFWRREGLSSVLLRLPGVYELTPEREARMKEGRQRNMRAYEELAEMSDDERQERIDLIINQHEELRHSRAFEYPKHYPDIVKDLQFRRMMFGYSNMWASVDARDSAQAIELGLTADYEGSHPLYINDSHNSAGIDTELLIKWFYPEAEFKRPLVGTETAVSIDAARKLLGYEPEYSISRWY